MELAISFGIESLYQVDGFCVACKFAGCTIGAIFANGIAAIAIFSDDIDWTCFDAVAHM